MKSRNAKRGSALIEFALSSLFWMPLLLGTIVIGLNLLRAIRVTQICRDAGHMYAYGIDFSQPSNRNLLLRLATGLNITATGGDGVVIFSSITLVGPGDCTAAGLQPDSAHCANLGNLVFTKRLVVGSKALRASSFGTPNSYLIDSSGAIRSSRYLTDTSARAVGFSNLMSLTSGQYAYVAEAYFSSPDYDWQGFMTGTGVAARSIF